MATTESSASTADNLMSENAAAEITTAEALWERGFPGRAELVRGEFREMSPAGSRHGVIAIQIGARLNAFVRQHQLGVVFGAETGFIIETEPDTVRAPDAAFVCQQRVKDGIPEGFFPGPPDLAVEVLSPRDQASEVGEKVEMWLRSGCRAVWLVDPKRQVASICRLNDDRVTSMETPVLEDAALLPGFRLQVAELFA